MRRIFRCKSTAADEDALQSSPRRSNSERFLGAALLQGPGIQPSSGSVTGATPVAGRRRRLSIATYNDEDDSAHTSGAGADANRLSEPSTRRVATNPNMPLIEVMLNNSVATLEPTATVAEAQLPSSYYAVTGPEATVAHTAGLMSADPNVSCVVVVASSTEVHVMDRQAVDRVCRYSHAPTTDTVGAFLRGCPPCATVGPEASVAAAGGVLLQRGGDFLPIMAEGHFMGLLGRTEVAAILLGDGCAVDPGVMEGVGAGGVPALPDLGSAAAAAVAAGAMAGAADATAALALTPTAARPAFSVCSDPGPSPWSDRYVPLNAEELEALMQAPPPAGSSPRSGTGAGVPPHPAALPPLNELSLAALALGAGGATPADAASLQMAVHQQVLLQQAAAAAAAAASKAGGSPHHSMAHAHSPSPLGVGVGVVAGVAAVGVSVSAAAAASASATGKPWDSNPSSNFSTSVQRALIAEDEEVTFPATFDHSAAASSHGNGNGQTQAHGAAAASGRATAGHHHPATGSVDTAQVSPAEALRSTADPTKSGWDMSMLDNVDDAMDVLQLVGKSVNAEAVGRQLLGDVMGGAAGASAGAQWMFKYLYDGDCAVCRTFQAMLEKLDHGVGKVAFVDISQGFNALDHAGINYKAAMETIHILSANGQVFKGVTAVIKLLAAVDAEWAANLGALPTVLPLLSLAYLLISKNRHHISGAWAQILKATHIDTAVFGRDILGGMRMPEPPRGLGGLGLGLGPPRPSRTGFSADSLQGQPLMVPVPIRVEDGSRRSLHSHQILNPQPSGGI
ncbi:hypothetical protein HYH03_004363 [Edaphochlamys debaryana]|uniref:CBS domain-containing protein n=1 Tax=Edaphochlamys debaryana TaxID=47281 RepID=A0A836C3A4_9CHLO|nr:hypothetical protein HYH03_004363 [Edaphochlamys debaryana]|eukprot:KAG2497622.1 hypothetical protein HYH03_004363 [Edaphochlamys debaryana]